MSKKFGKLDYYLFKKEVSLLSNSFNITDSSAVVPLTDRSHSINRHRSIESTAIGSRIQIVTRTPVVMREIDNRGVLKELLLHKFGGCLG